MLLVFVLGAFALGLAATAATASLRRTRRRRAAFDAMADRLARTYDVSSYGGGVSPLVSPPGPPGDVAIDTSGLHLRLGDAEAGLRFVPWSAVQSVMPVASGRSAVRVSRVGSVLVPAVLGRRIWDAAGREGAAKAERPRAARV